MGSRTPPRFVARTMATTFGTVVLIRHPDAAHGRQPVRPGRGARRAQEFPRGVLTAMKRQSIAAAVLLALCSNAAAWAQESVAPRLSADTTVSATMFSSYKHVAAMFDATVSLDMGRGLTAIARPWAWKRQDGTSTFEWYQLQIRYQSRSRLPVRVDAGIITSPLGLNTLQQRADLNPAISTIFYYVAPLPRFDVTFDGLNMMSAGYPLGAIVTTSGARWDLRGGVTNSTPARQRVELKRDEPPAMAQLVLGGGVTPRPGMRIGAGFAHGGYRSAAGAIPAASATVLTLEGEYAFNQTRLSGEWVRDRFGTTPGPSIAHAFYLQGVQTITPRLFGAARVVRVQPPPLFLSGIRTNRTTAELTAGYRLTRDWTVRGAYFRERRYLAPAWQHQAAVSVVWSRRWY